MQFEDVSPRSRTTEAKFMQIEKNACHAGSHKLHGLNLGRNCLLDGVTCGRNGTFCFANTVCRLDGLFMLEVHCPGCLSISILRVFTSTSLLHTPSFIRTRVFFACHG